MRLLFPDAPLDDLSIEREATGPGIELVHYRETDPARVPASAWAECDGIVCYHLMHLDAAALARTRRCRIIVRAGVGFDNVDLEAAAARGIAVCNTPDYGTTDVADHAIAMLLDLTRGVPRYAANLKRDPVGGWRWQDGAPNQRRLRGARFGVVGLGRIGVATARRAAAFDMKVGFYDPHLPPGVELAHNFERFDTLETLLAASDVVSLHTPLTPATRGLIDAAAVAAMKPGAILINTARGPVVDLDAVYDGLKSGRIGGAGLDVLPSEPPDPKHPLIAAYAADAPWLRDRLVLSPHSAFYCPESLYDLRYKTAETAAVFLLEGRLRACVNSELLPRHEP
ncbi:MAG TPA: C-terminal binding protein [Alphaproteobacteria bacterium]